MCSGLEKPDDRADESTDELMNKNKKMRKGKKKNKHTNLSKKKKKVTWQTGPKS